MMAYEFHAAINDGIIHIPAEYKNKVSKKVKVIILSEELIEQPKKANNEKKVVFDAMKLDTYGFVFNREEANER